MRRGDPDPFDRFTDEQLAAVIARAKAQEAVTPQPFRAQTIRFYEAALERRQETKA